MFNNFFKIYFFGFISYPVIKIFLITKKQNIFDIIKNHNYFKKYHILSKLNKTTKPLILIKFHIRLTIHLIFKNTLLRI